MEMNKVQKLIRVLENNNENYEVPRYQIIETVKNKESKYILHKIVAEIADNFLIFSDIEETLPKIEYILSGFTIDSVCNISIENSKYTITLLRDMGVVEINLI